VQVDRPDIAGEELGRRDDVLPTASKSPICSARRGDAVLLEQSRMAVAGERSRKSARAKPGVCGHAGQESPARPSRPEEARTMPTGNDSHWEAVGVVILLLLDE
jgi:hypothetical protein